MSNGNGQELVSEEQMEYTNSCLRDAYNLAGRGRVRNLIRKSLLPQIIEYRNCKIHLHPNDNFSEFVIWRKRRSQEELELNWLEETFSGASIKVLDIGANFGLYSLFFASILHADSRIHAFEPNPTMFGRLRQNCCLNGFENIDLHPYALSDRRGEAMLVIERRGDAAPNLGEARITNDKTPINISKYETKSVQTRTLLELTHLHGADFAKLDVEGHEPNILLPFLDAATDASLPQYLQLETVNLGDHTETLFAAIARRGFNAVFQTERNTVFKR